MSLQSFDGVDVLRQLRLPPHQYFVLLQILQTLKAQENRPGLSFAPLSSNLSL